jgi:hypothetical protein
VLKNINGLRQSAQRRSQTAMEKAQSAIRRMQAEEASINFRMVATRAGVSPAWLYINKESARPHHETAQHSQDGCG